MKKSKKLFLFLVLCCCFFGTLTTFAANSKKYLVTKNNKTYYSDKKGVNRTGWKKIGGAYYFFSYSKGVMQKNKKISGVKLDAEGKAIITKKNKEKVQTMARATKIVDKITKPSWSKSKKRLVCYKWVIKHPYRTTRKFNRKNKKWVTAYANDILKGSGGNCLSDGAAFAFLAQACGYSKVYVCSDTAHGWCEIKGKVYDPLFSESRGFKKYYGRSYKGYGGMHPVDHIKL